MNRSIAVLFAVLGVSCVQGFTLPTNKVPASRTNTQLGFGIPSFGSKDEDKEEQDPKLEKKSIGLQGLVQLITAGAGSPFLGEFQVRSRIRKVWN
jgi:hypothetical protein